MAVLHAAKTIQKPPDPAAFVLSAYLPAIAAINSAQAAVDETVRTWFHKVQSVRKRDHSDVASWLAGSAAASASFRGTLKVIVTPNMPST